MGRYYGTFYIGQSDAGAGAGAPPDVTSSSTMRMESGPLLSSDRKALLWTLGGLLGAFALYAWGSGKKRK